MTSMMCSLSVLQFILLLLLRNCNAQVVQVKRITSQATSLSSPSGNETVCTNALLTYTAGGIGSLATILIGLCGDSSGGISSALDGNSYQNLDVKYGNLSVSLTTSSGNSWDGKGTDALIKAPEQFHVEVVGSVSYLRFIDASSCARFINLNTKDVSTLLGECGNGSIGMNTATPSVIGMTYLNSNWFFSVRDKGLYTWDETSGGDPLQILAVSVGEPFFTLTSHGQFIWQKVGNGIRRYDESTFASAAGNLTKGVNYVTFISSVAVDPNALRVEQQLELGNLSADVSVSPDGKVLLIGDHETDKIYFLDIQTHNETSKDIEALQEMCSTTTLPCSLSDVKSAAWSSNDKITVYEEISQVFTFVDVTRLNDIPDIRLDSNYTNYGLMEGMTIRISCELKKFYDITYLSLGSEDGQANVGCDKRSGSWVRTGSGIDLVTMIDSSMCTSTLNDVRDAVMNFDIVFNQSSANQTYICSAMDAATMKEYNSSTVTIDSEVMPTTTTTLAPTTTVPAPTTTVLAPTTTVPAPTTTVPAPTTTVPAPTTAVPAPTTAVPAPTTAVPAPTATVPAPATTTLAPTTTVPAPTTAVPAPTTAVPAPTTAVPAPTTAVPAPTTTVPVPTTTVPAPTTTVPAPNTTRQVPTTTTVLSPTATTTTMLPETTTPTTPPVRTPTTTTTKATTAAPGISLQGNWSSSPDFYTDEMLTLTCRGGSGYSNTLGNISLIYTNTNTNKSFHVGCIDGVKVASHGINTTDPSFPRCYGTAIFLTSFTFSLMLTAEHQGGMFVCKGTLFSSSESQYESNQLTITSLKSPPTPITMGIEPLPILKSRPISFYCNSSTSDHMDYLYRVRQSNGSVHDVSEYTLNEIDRPGVTLICINKNHPNWKKDHRKLEWNVSYYSDANLQIKYKSNGDPDFYRHDITHMSCEAFNFTGILKIGIGFHGMIENHTAMCQYNRISDVWHLDNSSHTVKEGSPINSSGACERIVANGDIKTLTIPVNNTRRIENGTFQCLAYEGFTGSHYMAGLNVTKLKEQPTKQDVNMTIDPWPIVEGSPFTVSCVSSSRSVDYGYTIRSRDGQVLSNTSSYTPTSSDVSGIRVNCFDTVHPNWRPQGRALIISSDFNGVAGISNEIATHPDIYVRQPNLITCMATNFTYLSEISLVYHNKTSNSQPFKIGCELDETGHWVSKTSGDVTHPIKVQPFECPAAMTGSSLVNLQFNVTLMSHMVNGYFYCHTVDSGNGEKRTTTNVTVDEVKVAPLNVSVTHNKDLIWVGEEFNFTCMAYPPQAQSRFIYSILSDGRVVANGTSYTPIFNDTIYALTLMCVDIAHPNLKNHPNTTTKRVAVSGGWPRTTSTTTTRTNTRTTTSTTRRTTVRTTARATTRTTDVTENTSQPQRVTFERDNSGGDADQQEKIRNRGTPKGLRAGSIVVFVVSSLLLIASIGILAGILIGPGKAMIDPNIQFMYNKWTGP